MNFINILESYILPTIYFALYAGALCVLLLILLRIKQMSLYQHRIIKALNPNLQTIDNPFAHSLKHFINQFYKETHRFLVSSKILNQDSEERISNRLEKIGNRSELATTRFILMKSSAAILMSVVFLLLNNYFLSPQLSLDQPLLFMLIGLFTGIRLFESYIDKSIVKYRDKIRKALPDALDLMAICFEAGYSNEHALDKISEEFSELFPELSNEFYITANELKVLPDRKLAWKNFATRTELSEVNAIASAFQQNDKYGTSIVSALRTQVEMFRKNRILRAEEKAAKIPVLLAIPLSIFFLPILFVIILSPAVLRIYSLM